MEHVVCIGLTTFDKKSDAQEAAFKLVQQKLVACAQVEGPIKSFYHWNGTIQEDNEYRLVLKFPESQIPRLSQAIKELHPYDNPQWVVLKSASALPAYAQWVYDTTEKGSSH